MEQVNSDWRRCKLAWLLCLCALLAAGISGGSPAQAKNSAGPASPGIVDIWGGARAFIALRLDGSVWTWGWDDYGILGNGYATTMFMTSTLYDELTPFQVLGAGGVGHLTGIQAIAGGERHNAALDANGDVWTWGWNAFDQLGNGIFCSQDPHSTQCMGLYPAKVPGLSNVKMISARGYHTLALKKDGSTWAWGFNGNGRLGDGTTNDRHSPVPVNGLEGHGGVLAISGGGAVNMALMADHSLLGWGENDLGAVGDGTWDDRYAPTPVSQASGLKEITAVSTGWGHVVALAKDGSVWTWGQNGQGELGDGTNQARNLPFQVPGLADVTAVSAGDAHTIVLKKDGTVWAWGANANGQLGVGSIFTSSAVPVQVKDLKNVLLMRGRNFNSLAIKADGSVWAWGDNGRGCGDGTRGYDLSLPVKVLFPDILTQPLFLPALQVH